MAVEKVSVIHGYTQPVDSSKVENKPYIALAEVNSHVGPIKLTLNAVDTAGGVFAWENDTGYDLIVDLAYIDVTTASTGACTVDIGVAANGTTLNDTIIDGLDVNAATGVSNNIDNAGTNGGIGVKVADGQWLTASVASGASAGIVGSAYIKIFKA